MGRVNAGLHWQDLDFTIEVIQVGPKSVGHPAAICTAWRRDRPRPDKDPIVVEFHGINAWYTNTPERHHTLHMLLVHLMRFVELDLDECYQRKQFKGLPIDEDTKSLLNALTY